MVLEMITQLKFQPHRYPGLPGLVGIRALPTVFEALLNGQPWRDVLNILLFLWFLYFTLQTKTMEAQ